MKFKSFVCLEFSKFKYLFCNKIDLSTDSIYIEYIN